MGKGLEGMQCALEQEGKGKGEAIRMKKKLETDVSELEMSLEHANAGNFEAQKSIKKYPQNCSTLISQTHQKQDRTWKQFWA